MPVTCSSVDAGNDSVSSYQHGGMFGGTFLGGDGNDQVDYLNGGTFDGGAGDDFVAHVDAGATFNGGPGDDSVYPGRERYVQRR